MRKLIVGLLAVGLMGAKGCTDCEKETAIAAAICQSQPDSQECIKAKEKAAKACTPAPVPTPTPEPTPTPVPVPTPTPTPVPVPTPTPTPTPPPSMTFPVRFPLTSATIYMRNSKWNVGVDSTIRVRDDRELCEALHHVPGVNDCHFDSDVWTAEWQRAQYEMRVMAGARAEAPSDAVLCATWQFRGVMGVAHPCHNDESVQHSCDHFGSTQDRDDPKTPEFEGKPVECGRQVDQFGPYAGFFMVPQKGEGDMFVRACLPLDQTDAGCAPWLQVDWR
jgi:hypothetical protein